MCNTQKTEIKIIDELMRKIGVFDQIGKDATKEQINNFESGKEEYGEISALNAMLENDIDILEIYANRPNVSKRELLYIFYSRNYFPLLREFGLAEHLPEIE